MERLIDAEVLKEEVSNGSILIEDDVLECETVHEIMVYVLAKLEDFVLEKIDEQPTVEAKKVVRGEWEVVRGVMTPGGDPLLRCPVCRSNESCHMGGIEMPQHWNFCPVCGADMRGVE